MLQNQLLQPKVIEIRRRPNQGFGFTLRHFIAYPPESWPSENNALAGNELKKAMETVFIKEVHPQGPAYCAGLQCGDRVLMVNGIAVAGISYSTIVSMIKQTAIVLRLQVVPKECDVLQMYYTDIAHTPETNRLRDIKRPQQPITTATHNLHLNSRMISYSPEGEEQQYQSIADSDIYENPRILIQQKQLYQQQNEGFQLRPVLNKPKHNDNDFMMRLRKSIEQKEEFLKSTAPEKHDNQYQNSNFNNRRTMYLSHEQQQHILPATLSKSSEKFPISTSLLKSFPLREQFSEISPSGNNASAGRVLENNQRTSFASKSLNEFYTNDNNVFNNKKIDTLKSSNNSTKDLISIRKQQFFTGTNSTTDMIKDKFHRELEFSESFPEVGVTNQVFERKLVSNIAKNFEPFKQLSVSTGLNSESEANLKFDFPTENSSVQRTGADLRNIESSISNLDTRNKDNSPENGEMDDLIPLTNTSDVVRRSKVNNFNDDKKPKRRISYLRATNSEINDFHLDVVNDILDVNDIKIITPIEIHQENEILSNEINCEHNKNKFEIKNGTTEIFGTEMEIKSSCIYGKRISEYRSWIRAKIELNGNILKICTSRGSKTELNVMEMNIRNFNVIDETIDKKKFVFRLQTKPPKNVNIGEEFDISLDESSQSQINEMEYTDILFKTKNLNEMKTLFLLLQTISNSNNHKKQLAQPQQKAASASYRDISPILVNKSNENEVGITQTDSISPIMKNRKSTPPNQKTEKDLGSPRTKNWKDLLFRRIHGSSSTSSTEISSYTTSVVPLLHGSIGVPLKLCQMSTDNEYLPMIVDVCTRIVETKGLSVIGIYRIPGNKAAISELKDQVNKIDFDWDKVETDVRWEDVNVVSSLLKLFIRSLPDGLLPTSFYINFIEADKKIGERRLKELKYLLNTLPPFSYETMRHLIRHLNRVSKNSDVNLMEAKNLAIIFGPSIIRTPNETLEIAVKDMKHQCRIVELLVTQYDYFFENGEFPNDPGSPPITIQLASQQDQKTSLLLDNVSKIENRLNDKESLTSRFIPRFRSHSKRSSGESVLSLEYKKLMDQSSNRNSCAKLERNTVDVAILLTDEDSSNSRISDTGSMSLTQITDTLDSKLRSLRSGSESTDETDSQTKAQGSVSIPSRRSSFSQPLHTFGDNIPYADESPERNYADSMHLQQQQKHQSTNFIRDITKNIALINPRFSSVYESSDNESVNDHEVIQSSDSEVSTTSDPKDNVIITPLFLERYKKRRLFRSASFNCRSRGSSFNTVSNQNSKNNLLTKDEKTDMNLSKKRQIQNKQNRSIKRRHTINGPNEFSNTDIGSNSMHRRLNNNKLKQEKKVKGSNHVVEVDIRIKNVNRRN